MRVLWLTLFLFFSDSAVAQTRSDFDGSFESKAVYAGLTVGWIKWGIRYQQDSL